MKKSTGEYLMIGGGALVVYLLLSKKSTATSVTTPLTSTSRPSNSLSNQNLLNPNYQLTAAECSQYYANYLDLRQACPGWVGGYELSGGNSGTEVYISTLNQAIQRHWTLYGCFEHRTFLPLIPPDQTPFQPAPENPTSSGGGSGWVGTALKIATGIITLLGTGEKLNDEETEILLCGSGVINEILPMFSGDRLVPLIEDKLNTLIPNYIPNGY